MKQFLWFLAVGLMALLACTQVTAPPDEPTGTVAQAFTGSYQATVAWTSSGCTVCGATTYGCYSLGNLTPLTFTDQTPVGGIVTNVTVTLNGVYTSSSVLPTINGTAIGAAENPGNDGEECNECESPEWALANGSGVPGWVYRGTNSLAVEVNNNDACIHNAVVSVTYTYKETSSTSVASNANPSVFGQSVTLTATVTPLSNGPATGTVTFADGATPLGTATLNGAEQAFLPVSTLAVGTHSIVATYNGDSNFQASSGSISQVVNKAATTTTVASSANPATVGESVTFTATVAVSAPGAGIAGGTVTFFDGATSIGSGSLDGSGVATFATSALAVGTHPITASYGGSGSYNASTSGALSQVIQQDGTTVGLVSSTNPSTYGGDVTFTATVTTHSSGGTPTGTVTFADNGTPIGTSGLNGAGVATLSTSTLTGGSHTISASYSGDVNHGAASASLTQVVDVASSATALTSATNPSVFGQSVQLTATVTGAGAEPSGTVSFFDGGAPLGSSALNGSGQAILATAGLSVGTHAITAQYAGDGNHASSSSAALSQVVEKAATTTSLASSSNPSVVGSSVTFTASVVAAAPGAGTPTGTVNFADGGAMIGTGTLDGSGVATFTTSSLPVGTHTITATYGGDGSFDGSASGGLSQAVNVDGVTVTLVSSPNPSTYGATVGFTATVATKTTGGTPTGTVTFFDGVTQLGQGTLSGGAASFATAALAGGTHSITATYGGDADHAGGSSATLMQVVHTAATAASLAAAPNPSVFGQSVTLTATVTPSAGAAAATGTVTFSDGATTLGTGPVGAGGVATYATSTLSVGTHMLVAAYGGDPNYSATTTTAVTDVVTRADTTTTLTSSSDPSLVGTSVTFSATVTPTAPGSGTPTGTVTFSDGATVLGTGTVNAMGVATFATSTLPAGQHTITAAYAGDLDFAPSTSVEYRQSIATVAATVAVTATPSPTTYGGQETLTATVTGSTTPATGAVSFSAAAMSLGTSTLDSAGVATLTASGLPAGTLTITATYAGDALYAGATGTTMLEVDKAATTTTLVSSMGVSYVYQGQSVSFVATVTSPASGFTGGVAFMDGSTMLGTLPVNSGTATFSTTALGVGGHVISAVYSGDTNFLGSSSSALTETVLVTSSGGDAGPGDASTSDAASRGGHDGGTSAASAASGSSGCGCRTARREPASAAGLPALLGLAGVAVARRRRRRR